MEHIPEKDLNWVIEELFILTKKLVFTAVPTYLSKELLDDNINTHLTVNNGLWWRNKIESFQKKINQQVLNIDDFGANGDFVESQAFAYLAIRSFLNLPISFPETTGCKAPCTGGVIVKNY